MKGHTKGFTLIELLVVIAIVAILAVVVILTLNPAELLKQARDSNRVSDLNTLKSAISVYLADVSSPSLVNGGTYNFCTESGTSTQASCGFASSAAWATISMASSSFAVDGSGWIPVKFTDISSGAPIGSLPKDPTNAYPYIYRYLASSTLTFKLMVPLESTKYTTGAASTTVTGDGGVSSTAYEVGTALGM